MAGERTRTVAVRLTPEEYAGWEAAARAAGRGRMGSWARDAVAAYLDGSGAGKRSGGTTGAGRAVTGPALGELDMEAVTALAMASALRGELARVGNNLNQAVRLVHVHGADPAAVAQLQETVEQVRAVMGAVHQMSTPTSRSGAAGSTTKRTRSEAGRGAARGARGSAGGVAEGAAPTPQATAKPVTSNPWISGDKR